jgi:Ca2+:H+ antiporter
VSDARRFLEFSFENGDPMHAGYVLMLFLGLPRGELLGLRWDERIGLSTFFVGVIVVAVVGNAAEHWVAAYFASRDKMHISVNIAVGSGAQIALFVAPVLVLASFVIGPFPMALVFNGFELGAIFLAIIIADQVTQRGESTWFEGLQLLAIYSVLGLTFFFVS